MNQQVSLFAIALGLSAFGMLAFAGEDCYFPKKSGCGSGDDFCSSGHSSVRRLGPNMRTMGAASMGRSETPVPGSALS